MSEMGRNIRTAEKQQFAKRLEYRVVYAGVEQLPCDLKRAPKGDPPRGAETQPTS